jgi:YidC/Oxa1 family membrane protein insertase
MDKNTVTGIVLIFLILIGFSYFNRPSKEEITAAKHKNDSLRQVELARQIKTEKEAKKQENTSASEAFTDSISSEAMQNEKKEKYGVFADASEGKEQFYVLENNLIKVTISNKGGKIYSVELKNYKTHDSLPVILLEGDKNSFGMSFFAQNRSINTDDFFFVPTIDQSSIIVNGPPVKKGKEGNEEFNEENGGETKSLSMHLDAGNNRYIEYRYTIKYNSFLLGFDINLTGLNNIVSSNSNYLNFVWGINVPRQERVSQYGEDRYTRISYKYFEDEVDKLAASKSETEQLRTRTKWVSFKQLFFSSTLIADTFFPEVSIDQEIFKEDPEYLGNFKADFALPYKGSPNENHAMKFYFGPNHYSTLKQYGLSMERLINLGYAIVRPVNKYLIIPVFNFLRRYIDNFGIIILLLTIFIKLILFPFTYKSYMSQAKMKALKPEIDEINAKYGQDKAMEKQQATMALYKKAGVNPMGGCLPMLLQFPVLVAMFFFFPTSIELRQQSFLWAHDLSTYDSILNLPFKIPFYGDHVSLFCLLMTITTIISTHLNSQSQNTSAMPGMKTMMYMMPIMFLFILNSYSAGLSYYYFLANLITIVQMYIFRKMIDEKKIRVQIQLNKKKPNKPKSGFQKKLEEMAKQRGVK